MYLKARNNNNNNNNSFDEAGKLSHAIFIHQFLVILHILL